MSDDKKNSDSRRFWSWIIAGTMALVCALWFGVGWWLPGFSWPGKGPEGTEAALRGDSFGAVNSLFSGLAFGGIILTLILQRKELELQRRELEDTRRELKRSAKAQEASEKALVASAFAQVVVAQRQALAAHKDGDPALPPAELKELIAILAARLSQYEQESE